VDLEHQARSEFRAAHLLGRVERPEPEFLSEVQQAPLVVFEEGERFAVADPGQEIGLEGDELLVDEAVDEVEEHLLFFAEVGAGLS